jgi:dipeptidyl aminopeptidase/acylaminoacyl peptidase
MRCARPMVTRCGVLLLALLGLVGSAHTAEIQPGDKVQIKEGIGVLAIDFDAPQYANLLKIDRVGSLLGWVNVNHVHAGHNFRLFEIPAGEYRWSRIDLMSGWEYLRVRDDPRYRFRVLPGVINYPGTFEVTNSVVWGRYHFSVGNHMARVLATLDHDYAGTQAKFPVRYLGELPDPFAEFVRSELGERSAYAALEAGGANLLPPPDPGTDPRLHAIVDELFAPPRVSLARMNPAGDLIAMIEYRDGKHRVSLVDAQSQQAVDVYRGDERVGMLYWASDRTLLLQLADPDGSSNYVVHVESGAGGAPTFSPVVIPGRGWFIDPLPHDGSHAIYGHLDSDGAAHIFRIDLAGKRFDPAQFRSELRLDKGLKNAYYGFADGTGVLRVAQVTVEGDYALMYRPAAAGTWSEIKRYGADIVFDPLLLSADGGSLIVRTNEGRDQVDLVRIELPSGRVAATIYSAPGADVENAIVGSFDRRVVAAMVYRDGRLQTDYLDLPDASLQASLQKALPGKNIAIFDSSADQRRSLVLASDEVDPGMLYLFDATSGQASELLSLMGPMPDVQLVRSQIVKLAAADGLPIEAYLTLPHAATPPYPLVVMPHGGPFGVHDALSFDPEVELLANRGYAVLRVNYRGSGGFGRAFEEAGFGAWGRRIEDDIQAALDMVLRRGGIDGTRVAIRGTSYGGYSALMGLIRAPEQFRCGIAVSAVTDLPLLFSSSDWSADKALRERMRQVVGDPASALADLQSVSPDYQYRRLERPLLIVHGAQDRRVPVEHMLRLLLLLGHAKRPPQSLVFSDEGHGVKGLASRYQLEAAADRFLAACTAPRGATPAGVSAH